MKIVHVIPTLTRGGAERVVVDLANHAAEAGHTVTILAAIPAPHEQLEGAISPKVELRHISSRSTSVRRLYPKLLPWILRHWHWLRDQEIVHCHLTLGAVFGTILQGLRQATRSPTPAVIETYHAVGMAIPRRQRAFHAALLGNRDGVAFMADDPHWTRFRTVRRDGLWATIPNGTAPRASPTRAKLEKYRTAVGIPAGALVLGSVTRLAAARRPDLLIDAFACAVRNSERELHLLLAGEGAERARLEEQARVLGLADRIHLPGLTLDSAEPLMLIDLYLTVSVGAMTGIAALEAAHAGVPIIGLQLQPAYRASPGDWIWSSADPDELGRRAAELLANSRALKGMARTQQDYVRAHHGVEAMAQAYDRLYGAVLGRRGIKLKEL